MRGAPRRTCRSGVRCTAHFPTNTPSGRLPPRGLGHRGLRPAGRHQLHAARPPAPRGLGLREHRSAAAARDRLGPQARNEGSTRRVGTCASWRIAPTAADSENSSPGPRARHSNSERQVRQWDPRRPTLIASDSGTELADPGLRPVVISKTQRKALTASDSDATQRIRARSPLRRCHCPEEARCQLARRADCPWHRKQHTVSMNIQTLPPGQSTALPPAD